MLTYQDSEGKEITPGFYQDIQSKGIGYVTENHRISFMTPSGENSSFHPVGHPNPISLKSIDLIEARNLKRIDPEKYLQESVDRIETEKAFFAKMSLLEKEVSLH